MSDLLSRITIDANQCGGRPCIRGMRIRVQDVLDMLAGGASHEETGRLSLPRSRRYPSQFGVSNLTRHSH